MDNLTRMTPYQFNLSRPPPISTSYIRFKCSYVCLLEGVLAVFLRYRCHRRTLSTVTGVRFRHFAFRSGVEFSLVSESFGIPRFPFLPDGFFRRGHGVPFILQDGIDTTLVFSVFGTERMFHLASRMNAKMGKRLARFFGCLVRIVRWKTPGHIRAIVRFFPVGIPSLELAAAAVPITFLPIVLLVPLLLLQPEEPQRFHVD
mmetsp:Transcript_44363/g.51983  ORF Transcript_44363/g.51983 Transcript_44363/m.51983 type:complete len:202 (+) Transcript_44363:73-678(+)